MFGGAIAARGVFASTWGELRGSVADTLSNTSLLSARALSAGMNALPSPGMDGWARGASMHALSLMAQRCIGTSSLPSTITTSGDTSSWLGPVVTSRINAGADRDLIYLLDHQAVGAWNPTDFQLDPNVEEVRKAEIPLATMFQRSAQLLARFPGNEILLHVCKIAAKVSGFHLTTPLGKMLISVELLLRKAQEWEQYASREFSLVEEIAVLGRLIGRWRQVELQSWESLLRCKEMKYVHTAMGKWFAIARILTALPTNPPSIDTVEDLLEPAGRGAGPQWLMPSYHDKQHEIAAAASAAVAKMELDIQESSETIPDGADTDAGGTGAGGDTRQKNSYLRYGGDGDDADRERELAEKAAKDADGNVYLHKIFDILDGFLRSALLANSPPAFAWCVCSHCNYYRLMSKRALVLVLALVLVWTSHQ